MDNLTLDPDPKSMNLDPQHWIEQSKNTLTQVDGTGLLLSNLLQIRGQGFNLVLEFRLGLSRSRHLGGKRIRYKNYHSIRKYKSINHIEKSLNVTE